MHEYSDCHVRCVEIPSRVVPAEREALERFPAKALHEYADDIHVGRGANKPETIDRLVKSGKATLCAWLGN